MYLWKYKSSERDSGVTNYGWDKWFGVGSIIGSGPAGYRQGQTAVYSSGNVLTCIQNVP